MSADCVGTGCKAESLLKRIAELEAELLSALAQVEHNGNELTALRQKIEDAPVVAWLLNGKAYPEKQYSLVTYEEVLDQAPLIRKEDLK